jgi:hypothetical protein
MRFQCVSVSRLGLVCLVLTVAASLPALGEQRPAQSGRPVDVGKRIAESPARRVVAGSTDQRRDHAKAEAEAPARTIAARSSGAENPRVAPGLVRWHADFAAARAAAERSGKPVLLFQMLGKLDDLFC